MTNSLVNQIARLEAKLADAEELIDLYVETAFETQTQLADKEVEVQRSLIIHNSDQDELKAKEDAIARMKSEVQTLTHRNQENLDKLQSLERSTAKQLAAKEKHIETLQEQMKQLKEIGATPKGTRQERTPHKGIPQGIQEQAELTKLRAEVKNLQTAMAAKREIPDCRTNPESGHNSHRPLEKAE